MTEEEFNAVMACVPLGTQHIADGHETKDADGKDQWAISMERLINADGHEIARLQRSPPLLVDTGCPWKSGLLGGRKFEVETRES